MAAKILIVEDESELGALLIDVMAAAGYDAVLSTSTRAAASAQDAKPQAIVTDYLMPGLNGAQVIARIREAMPGSVPPVILVTGLQNAGELAGQMGAFGYLRKPFDMDELVELVARATRI